ncbi:MAG: hypothetical protein RR646_06745 [Erysipelotrichaceae bacterium]
MLERIVKEGLKVDFHIHSIASYHKDKGKVSKGSIENTSILINKIIENEVNVISIADHDNFDYDLYKRIKEEESKGNCIKLVIPAVEFSVIIDETELHIVVLFDNSNDTRIKKIQSRIYDTKTNKPKYNNGNLEYFSEKTFLEILREIDTNAILIAHQKNSLSSTEKRKNDANNLDEEKFSDLVFLEYFESLEFKNKRNEIFNKDYLSKNKEKLRNIKFITGSDCHDWSNYPEENSDGSFAFSYFKCLPTFRGLMMSVTDSRRIKVGTNSFFSKSNYKKNFKIKIDCREFNIDLSEGINAIIGDNSIGKSMLIHKLTDYEYLGNSTIERAYEKYLTDNKIELVESSKISKSDIRNFDKQGNIRDIFANSKTKGKDFLNDYYPNEPNYDIFSNKIKNLVEEFLKFVKQQKKIKLEEKNIQNFKIEILDEKATSMQIVECDISYKDKIKSIQDLISEINIIIAANEKLVINSLVDVNERKEIAKYVLFLNAMTEKYEKVENNFVIETNKIGLINTVLTNKNKELILSKTDDQKTRENYKTNITNIKNSIVNLVKLNSNLIEFKLDVKEEILGRPEQTIGEYRFSYKPKVSKINNDYLREVIQYPINKKTLPNIDFTNFDIDKFEANIKAPDECTNLFEHYKNEVDKKILDDFKYEGVINKAEDDVTKGLSSGASAQIYFDLLSKDNKKKGIYLIDQPEDDVSQPSIRKRLLDNFKNISEYRQVIMITHNPQFIVNLDVDNIIFIKKDEITGEISIENGALEYKDDTTDVLKIVADNIEGGIDSIRERYKKYEKNN